MPWEFEGPDRNPLRNDAERRTQLKELIDATPGKRTCSLTPFERMLILVILTEAIPMIDTILARLPRADAVFNFRDAKKRSKEPLERSVNLTEEDCSFDIRVSSKMMVIKTVLSMTMDELRENQDPIALYVYNDLRLLVEVADSKIIESHFHISDLLSSIKSNMQRARKMVKGTISSMEMGIAKTEAGYEEACNLTCTIKEYAEKYHKARIEQNTLKIEISEKEQKKELYSKVKAIEDEHRANKLITSYVNQAIENQEETIKQWSEKYDRDIEEIDLKIATADQEIPELVADLARVLTVYYTRELEMVEYIRLRNYHLKVEDIGCFLDFFAVVIQSWWRGTMVRWELGPYSFSRKKRK